MSQDIIYTPFKNALSTLHELIVETDKPAYPTYLTDAKIKRFEYCFELSWKSLKRHLEVRYAVAVTRPRDILRHGHKLGYIRAIEDWLYYMEMRNRTSHTYNEDTAEQVLEIIPKFYKDAIHLLNEMETYDANRLKG
jgi:nucleotidyltransferase substrate binding protein (TIGR01987 family)